MRNFVEKFKYYIIGLIVLLLIGVMVKQLFFQPRIAFVKTNELMSKYAGMKEATAIYKKQYDGWKSKVDTLEIEYQRAVIRFNSDVNHLSPQKRAEQERYLQGLRDNLDSYLQATEQKAKEEDGKLTATVYNQVNALIEEYGKSKGYDAILGATSGGNVLYTRTDLDITDELLEELNKKYAGKK